MKTKQEREAIFREKLSKIVVETHIMPIAVLVNDVSSIKAVMDVKDTYKE